MSRGSDKRLRELILTVLNARGRKETTTPTLLNLLFLIDLQAYRELGRSISGKIYRKMPIGPVPRRFGHVIAAMLRDGDLRSAPTQPRDANGRYSR